MEKTKMRKSILLICAFLIVLPVTNAESLIIISMDYGENRWCGYSPFGSRKIMINTNQSCIEGEGYEYLLRHELKHMYFWKLPKSIQLRYCKENGYTYGKFCWENFANE